MPKKNPETKDIVVASGRLSPKFSVDVIDGFNRQINRARRLTLLTLKTLEGEDVTIASKDWDEDEELTYALLDVLGEVHEELQTLYTFMNKSYERARHEALAASAGAR